MALVKARKELPGKFIETATGEKKHIVLEKEGYLYDFIVVGSRTQATQMANDARRRFFRNVATKGRQFTNLDDDFHIPAGWIMEVDRFGLVMYHYWGDTVTQEADMKKFISNTQVVFSLNKSEIKDDIPLLWQGGIGLVGQSAGTNQFYQSIGVPSPQAIPKLKKTFFLDDDDVIAADVYWPESLMLDDTAVGNAMVRMSFAGVLVLGILLHGDIYTSGVKGGK
ncbi:MAG: hypothetical protein ABIJ56_18915 [Pseudomonadota bacterium]